MRWLGQQSNNVEDRRGLGGGGRMAVGGGIGTIILAVIGLLFGINPFDNSGGGNINNNQPLTQEQTTAQDQEAAKVSEVLKETEDVWAKIFQDQLGKEYVDPKLVLFTESDQSGCGFASAATGPFYCPMDSKVYLDLSFFDELENRFHAQGEFARAYVVAHEVGHHVQHLLGITDKVQEQQQNLSQEEINQLSVKVELQADYFAGVWAHHVQNMENVIEPGDIESALNAANAIGDDRLQKESQGYVVPDAFTHGTSQQRMHWFKKGYDSGKVSDGDTFNSSL